MLQGRLRYECVKIPAAKIPREHPEALELLEQGLPEDAAKPEHRSCCDRTQGVILLCELVHARLWSLPRVGLHCDRKGSDLPVLQSWPTLQALSGHFGPFFCSTAPQAFFRPDRRSLPPTREDAVKAGRASEATVRLGLDSGDHDGMLVVAGRMRGSCWRQLTARS